MRKVEQTQFEQVFEAHADELFRHASMRLSDRERAVELVQDAFLRTWDYVQKGGEVRDFRAFLFRTLRHLIIDEYRKHKTVSLEGMMVDEDDSVDRLLPPDESNTLEAAMDRHEGARVLVVLKDLPDLYREVILLRYIEGLTPQEIAVVLEESENVVSVRIHRGLKKLRTLLEPTL
jgi:RNA polymerase sigma-70 factor (ECF subfamily)